MALCVSSNSTKKNWATREENEKVGKYCCCCCLDVPPALSYINTTFTEYEENFFCARETTSILSPAWHRWFNTLFVYISFLRRSHSSLNDFFPSEATWFSIPLFPFMRWTCWFFFYTHKKKFDTFDLIFSYIIHNTHCMNDN